MYFFIFFLIQLINIQLSSKMSNINCGSAPCMCFNNTYTSKQYHNDQLLCIITHFNYILYYRVILVGHWFAMANQPVLYLLELDAPEQITTGSMQIFHITVPGLLKRQLVIVHIQEFRILLQLLHYFLVYIILLWCIINNRQRIVTYSKLFLLDYLDCVCR